VIVLQNAVYVHSVDWTHVGVVEGLASDFLPVQ
jgi:hypothetical protein